MGVDVRIHGMWLPTRFGFFGAVLGASVRRSPLGANHWVATRCTRASTLRNVGRIVGWRCHRGRHVGVEIGRKWALGALFTLTIARPEVPRALKTELRLELRVCQEANTR